MDEQHHPHGDEHDHGHGHSHGGGLGDMIGRLFHSHSHTSAVDSVLESNAQGIGAVKLSLGGLIVTAALQAAVFIFSGSVGLLADLIHNFSDALTAVPLWIAFSLASRRPSARYTYGYGRAEDLAGVFIVAMIALSSIVALWQAISRFLHPQQVEHLPWVVAAGLIGFAGNELVALYRVRTGRRIGSAALVADGLHARTDGITSLAVVAGALGVAVGWQWADPLVGVLISAAILWILKGAVRDIYHRLMDSVDPALVEQVRQVVSVVPGIEEVEDVKLRWIGHRLRAEVEVVSDHDLSLIAAHAIAVEAHHQLLHEVPRLAEAIVHTSPTSHDGTDPHHTIAHHLGTG
jgi:cation diffusion facilitator family transporter